MTQSFDPGRRGALKKLVLVGALTGSAMMFGNLLSPVFSKKESSAFSQSNSPANGVLYPSSTNPLPKSAQQPSVLYLGSLHNGTPSLQLGVIAGILARTQPQIYLTDSNFEDNNFEQSAAKHYGVTFNGSQNTNSLISMFGNQACGNPARWITYNQNYNMGSTQGQNDANDQLNAVRTMCAVYDALPVPAGQTPPIPHQTSPMYDISTWGTSVPLYQKVWNLVSGSISNQCLVVSPPSGGYVRLNLTDYIAMGKIFAFQVPLVQFNSSYPSVSAQKNFAATVINSFPIPYVVLGYTGIGQPGGGSNEVNFVSALSGGSNASNSALSGSTPSAHGGGYYTGSQLSGNLSVKSAFAPFTGAQFPNPASIPKYNPNQKYITIIASQGDCLDWTQNNNASYLLQSQSAGMPIGITMTLASQWLDPGIVNWYIDNINSNTGIVTSGSVGAGYNHVTQMPNISEFLATGAGLASVVNVKDFFFIEGPGGNPLTDAAQYIAGLIAGGITPRALWWWNNSGTAPVITSGTPSFFSALNISQTNMSSQSQCDTAISNAIKSARSNFIMLFLNTQWPNPAYLKNSCASHNCMPLPPGTFANLYRSANSLPLV